MKVLNEMEFVEQVEKSEDLVLVDFYAEWCGPCKMMSPILDQISEEVKDFAKVYKVDIDESQNLAVKYSIMAVPTMKIFKNGEIVDEIVGFQPKDGIINKLEAHK